MYGLPVRAGVMTLGAAIAITSGDGIAAADVGPEAPWSAAPLTVNLTEPERHAGELLLLSDLQGDGYLAGETTFVLRLLDKRVRLQVQADDIAILGDERSDRVTIDLTSSEHQAGELLLLSDLVAVGAEQLDLDVRVLDQVVRVRLPGNKISIVDDLRAAF